MRRALAIIAIVLVVLLGIDLVVTRIAEARVADDAGAALCADADAALSGWPVSLRLLSGRVPSAEITATQVPVGVRPGRIERVVVELTDITLASGRPGDAGYQPLRAATARFRASITAEEAETIADLPAIVAGIEITDEGLIALGPGTIRVPTDLAIKDGALRITPRLGALGALGALAAVADLEVSVPLDGLPAGAEVDEVSTADGRLELAGGFDPTTIAVDAPPRDCAALALVPGAALAAGVRR